MICDPCKNGRHCGRADCTCQHREAEKPPAQTISIPAIESAEEFGEM